jgi:hypothetical protein
MLRRAGEHERLAGQRPDHDIVRRSGRAGDEGQIQPARPHLFDQVAGSTVSQLDLQTRVRGQEPS